MPTLTRRSLLLATAAALLPAPPARAELGWAPPAPAIPRTAAGSELRWALSHINDGAAELSARDLERHFTSDFLSALPPEDLLRIFRSYLSPSGPMAVARFEGPVTETRLRAILITPGADWRVTLGLDPAAGVVNELFFEPVTLPAPLSKRVENVAALERRLAKVAPEVSVRAVELVEGEPRALCDVKPDTTLAVGSAFKLYVLGELARQIRAGTAAWDELLAVRDDLRSLPSGEMRLLPAGTAYPLRSWAEQMVSVSDNTATDHLIDRLGRERVEAAFAELGNATPARNVPLLLTREWFAIKLRLTATEVQQYLTADLETKRATLAGRVSAQAATLSEVEEWTGPYLIDAIEWFASAADLCRAMAALHGLAAEPGLAPIHDTLSIEPGIPFDGRTWAYVGYKGGYETGVKSDTWLLQRGDGRWFALSAIINDPTKEIDGVQLRQLMMPATEFLAAWE